MRSELGRPPQKKVLVVEDNDLNRRLMEVRLEIHGYASVTTSQGAAALYLARKHHPDLILMDIQLPDISGIEVIRRLKADEQTKAVPIIAVTAFAMPHERTFILESGCEAYLTKPFKGAELAQMMERYINPHQPLGHFGTDLPIAFG